MTVPTFALLDGEPGDPPVVAEELKVAFNDPVEFRQPVEFEAGAPVTVTEVRAKGSPWHDVTAYGAVGDGVADDTGAIQTALNLGRTFLPAGTFKVSPLTYPVGVGGYIRGSGLDETILVPAAANQPIFAMPAGDVDGLVLEGFTIKAHASGSSGHAIEMGNTTRSFRWCHFSDIGYLSNTGNFAVLFRLGGRCYGNTIERVFIRTQSGPGIVAQCTNLGEGALFNPNANWVKWWNIFANSGIITILDAGDSKLFVADSCHFEENTGAVCLIPGQQAVLRDSWIEGNSLTPIVPSVVRSVMPHYCVIETNHFSSTNALTIPAGVMNWRIAKTVGGLTVVDNGNENLQELGSQLTISEPNAQLQLQNDLAGATRWAIMFGATGGLNPGSLVFRNNDVPSNPFSIESGVPTAALRLRTTPDRVHVGVELEVDGALNHDGTTVGFRGATPQTMPAALVQTYATADRTLGAYTPDTESVAYTGAADGEAKLTDINALRVAYENLRAFTEDLAQFVNVLVDDMQAVGLEQ